MDFTYLDKINSPDDLKRICREDPKAAEIIAEELRKYIIEVVITNGGHLASNLGAIEITLALHLVFDNPSIVFDVGHQSYAHKIITGRFDDFPTLRKKDGISGFPKRSESTYDAFNTGHAGTSVSAVLGIARAKAAKGDTTPSIAVIGDGSMTSGMVFEALNDAGQSRLPIIIVLNDNAMAISQTVGALGRHLTKLRTSTGYLTFKAKTHSALRRIPVLGNALIYIIEKLKNALKYLLLPNVIFENMGLAYIGAVKGHDTEAICKALEIAKESERPVVVHVKTKKGKGYSPAEKDAEKYHGVSASGKKAAKTSNSKIVGETLCALAAEDEDIIAVTAAMPSGTGLIPFSKQFPKRFYDVGIAEEHAVTMAAGMATHGLKPFVAIYSTFLQRAYDQILHDVCLQNLPVVFGVDRAGLVGDDGETHQGVYDIAYLSTMPNLCIMSPSTYDELHAMIALSFDVNRPCAIRYNRGLLPEKPLTHAVEFGKWEVLREISDVCIIGTGRLTERALRIAEKLGAGAVNARFINPADYTVLAEIKQKSRIVITLEDGIVQGGFGAKITQLLCPHGIRVYNFGVPMRPIPHASVDEQDKMCGIDEEGLVQRISEIIGQLTIHN